MSESSDRCYVYIIGRIVDGYLTGPFKIGSSSNPTARLKELQTGSPHQLIIVRTFELGDRQKAFAVERDAHKNSEDFWEFGEWFNLDPVRAILIVALLTEIHGGFRLPDLAWLIDNFSAD